MKNRFAASAAIMMTTLFGVLPLVRGVTIFQGFSVIFDSGSLEGLRFDGYFSYNDRDLKRSGTEYLLRLDSLYDEERVLQSNEYDAFGSLGITIDGTSFGLGSRFEYSGPPSLRFEDGILTGLRFDGFVEHDNSFERIDRFLSLGDFGKRSAYYLIDNLTSQSRDFSVGSTILESDGAGPGARLAHQLRYYGLADWWYIKERAGFSAPYVDFVRNDEFDDNGFASADYGPLLIESLFAQSIYENGFGLLDPNGDYQALLTNLNPKQRATIDLPVSGSEALGFLVDLGDGTSQLVPLSDNVHVRTYVSTGTDQTFVIWMLDDTNDNTYRDFNDFIILGTLNAVPEPVWVISILSLVLIAMVLWRHRLTAVRQT